MLPRARLTLSNDTAIETLLTGIPLFCVGLVAFAVFTFFIVMRRISWLAVFLYLSSLFAFGAAIFDLSQLLSRGAAKVDFGQGLDTVRGLINTREVALSLSVGFRFAFFWSFIAEKPRGEPPPMSLPMRQLDPRDDAHCASWKRWGYLGLLLKWTLLALVIAIPALQMVWRIAARRMGTVYMINFTLEIIGSGLFVLKIFLNIFLSIQRPRYQPLLYYLAPLVALLCNLGVAVGALVFFPFSETVLGRFLQAIVLYLLIVYLLIVTFWTERRDLQDYRGRRLQRSTSSFLAGSAEKSDLAPKIDLQNQPPAMLQPPDRGTSLFMGQGSEFLLAPPLPPLNEQETLTPQTAGRSTLEVPQMSPAVSSAPSITLRRSPTLGMATMTSQPSPSKQRKVPDSPIATEPVVETSARVNTGISVLSNSSYYFSQGTVPSQRPELNEPRTDSPVYGLNGIVRGIPPSQERKLRRVSSLPSVAAASDNGTVSSLEFLLQQQTELDKSIAALKLLSPRSSLATQKPAIPPSPVTSLATPRPYVSRKTTDSTLSRAESSFSGKSELSLRDFPEPPNKNAATEIAPGARFAFAGVAGVQRRRSDSFPLGIPSTTLSELLTPTGISNAQQQSHERLGSHGTQYDVTSFIGDLSTPHFRGSVAIGSSEVSSDEEGSPKIVTADLAQPTRSVLLDSQRSSELRPFTYRSSTNSLRPLILSSVGSKAAPLYPSPLSRGLINTPGGPRQQGGAEPARITISKPRPLVLLSEQIANARNNLLEYERPRTPPQIETQGRF